MGRRAASAELLYLAIVVAAAAATGFWISHAVGFDLSGIQAAASALGLTETERHASAGYVAPTVEQASAPDAPYCAPGVRPGFSDGVTALATQVGDAIGTPVECEHAIRSNGDSVQLTSTGLVAYDRLSNTVSFTDGWHHWANTPDGLVEWEGSESAPPAG